MPRHISTYTGGIDRDSSKNKYPAGSYFKMKNFRMISMEELSHGAITSVKGNKSITISGSTNADDIVIGHCEIRNYLVVWTTNCHDATGGRGTIWRTDPTVQSPLWTKVYESATMMLTTQHLIAEEAIGYYESDTIIKVYWTDNFNMIRFIDIISSGPASVDLLNILPNVDLEAPVITNIGSGNIYVGKIQYAFQYYNTGGIETVFSPCTQLIHLTQASEGLTGSNIRLYEGSDALNDLGTPNNSGKSVTIKITNADTDYDKIRIVAILYRNLNQEPDIHILGEYDTANNLIVTDYGSYLGTLTLNAFRTLGNGELYCKTISQKGNKALIGNITENFFDVDFDARAYRNSSSGTAAGGNQAMTITALSDMDLAQTTNTALHFDPATPPAVAALTADIMGLAAVTSHLRVDYTESGSGSDTTDAHHSQHNGTSVIFTPGGSEPTYLVTIADIRVELVGHIPVDRTVTNITGIATTRTDLGCIGGIWHDSLDNGTGFNSPGNDTVFTLLGYNAGTGELTFNVTAGSSNLWDTGWDHIHIGYIFDMVYTYSYTKTPESFTYETTTNTDVVFTRDVVTDNPVNWLFHLTKASGNYIPCTTPFSSACITAIHLDISISYTYTAVGQPLIKVYNSKTATEDTILQTGSWPNSVFTIGGVVVPEDHDCICPYNYNFINHEIPELDTYTNGTYSYKYQSDLATLGGEGSNVKYEFVQQDMLIDESTNTRFDQPDIITIQDLSSYDCYKNPLRCASFMNLKRDEVYRIGLVAVSGKGQDSFVKWIGDIKIPTPNEIPTVHSSLSRQTYATAVGIKFTINTASLVSQGAVAIKIVRVERKEQDRSIYSQGIVSCMFADSGLTWLRGFPRAVVKTPTVGIGTMVKYPNCLQFISPEISYFKNLVVSGSHYYKVQGKLKRYSWLSTAEGSPSSIDVDGISEATTVISGGNHYDDLFNANVLGFYNYSRYYHMDALTTPASYTLLEGVIAGQVEYLAEDENEITLVASTVPFINRSINQLAGGTTKQYGPSGTCLISIIGSNLDITELVSADEYELFLVDYKIPGNAMSQYGGLTYEARQANTYIECGSYTTITGGVDDITVYGGDTTISFFEHLKTIWEVDDNDDDGNVDIAVKNRALCVVSIPVESVINSDLNNGWKFSKHYINNGAHAIREDAGTYHYQLSDGAINDVQVYIQEKNMYVYNTVYSQQNTSKVYFAKPSDWLATVHDDTLTKISLEKSPRETVDSFVKFLSDNEKMLPTQFGPINDLFLFKNYMIVFFDHAFGTLSIDERAVLPIQNNSLLEMGTANNLQYFDFISDKSGSVHPSSINMIGNGFGWYDEYKGEFGYYNGENQDLGLAKGLSSVIKSYTSLIKSGTLGSYFNNQFYGGNFLTFENRKYKETYCAMIVSELATFSSKVTNTSVVFTLAYSPGDYKNTKVVINGTEYYADITGTLGIGTLTINSTDNPGLLTAAYSSTYRWFVYYKDLSSVFAFSSVSNAFSLEVDTYPQWLINLNDKLYEIFYKMVVYEQNEGDYGNFYGTYRKGELEYLVNPQGSLMCIFNNYEYAMEAINIYGENVVGETWDSVKMYNDYQYSVGPSVTCTFSSATHKITKTTHGLELNDELVFSGTLPTEITAGTKYFVVNIETNDFRLATIKGGTPMTLSSNGTAAYYHLDIPLTVGTNVKRRIRTWRIKDLRDRGDMTDITKIKPRMRDSYIRILFKYLHGSNKKIILHDLYTFYMVTRENLYNQ